MDYQRSAYGVYTTAASMRGAKIKFHFDVDVVWAEANSSFDQGS